MPINPTYLRRRDELAREYRRIEDTGCSPHVFVSAAWYAALDAVRLRHDAAIAALRAEYPKCSECGRESGAVYSVPGSGELLCESCYNEAWVTCYHCGNETPSDNVTLIYDEHVCDRCVEDRYTTCDRCEETRSNDEMREVRHRGRIVNWCEHCRDNNDYSERQEPERILCGRSFKRWPFQRLVGMEYEYIAPVVAERFPERLRPFGEYHEDRSVVGNKAGDRGCELAAFPANGDALVRSVKTICGSLRNHRVNRTCGLHVHVDMQDTTDAQRGNVCDWFGMLEPLFLAMVSPSRRDNQYCQTWDDNDDSDERYRTLNITAFDKHGTYEFRMHQGSLNADKVLAWARLCVSFVEAYKDLPLTADTAARFDKMTDRGKVILFFQTCPSPLSLRKYVVKRMRQFAALDRASGRRPVIDLEAGRNQLRMNLRRSA